jgi:hypothetical protein
MWLDSYRLSMSTVGRVLRVDSSASLMSQPRSEPIEKLVSPLGHSAAQRSFGPVEERIATSKLVTTEAGDHQHRDEEVRVEASDIDHVQRLIRLEDAALVQQGIEPFEDEVYCRIPLSSCNKRVEF